VSLAAGLSAQHACTYSIDGCMFISKLVFCFLACRSTLLAQHSPEKLLVVAEAQEAGVGKATATHYAQAGAPTGDLHGPTGITAPKDRLCLANTAPLLHRCLPLLCRCRCHARRGTTALALWH
jgi:hypothetical protein